MKQVISKGLIIAGIALLTVPSSVLAQKEKEEKDKKETRQEMKEIKNRKQWRENSRSPSLLLLTPFPVSLASPSAPASAPS